METKKKRICWIRVLKNLSYCIIPILFASLILSIVSVLYVHETGVVKVEESYYETNRFIESYWNDISSNLSKVGRVQLQLIEEEQKDRQSSSSTDINLYGTMYAGFINDGEYTISGSDDKKVTAYYEYYKDNFLYVIIDNKNNMVYTNIAKSVTHTTIESLKEEVMSNKNYWTFDNGKIETNVGKLNEANVKNTAAYDKYLKSNQYTIYTAVRDDFIYYDHYVSDYIIFNIVKNQYENAIYNIPLAIILLIITIPIILIGIGKTKNEEGIHLTWFDKWMVEIATALIIAVTSIICFILYVIADNIAAIISIISIILGILTVYLACILLLETFVKRFKTHTFIKTTIAYWFCQKVVLVCGNMKLSFKIGLFFAIFAIANAIIGSLSENHSFMAFELLVILYIGSFAYVLIKALENEKIYKEIEEIYKGNTNARLKETDYKGELKKVATQLNDIAGGLSNAVDEKLKSERLKTELITNVSHDIKTPLTSIINYVDLLKKEDITTEKAAEYLAILDSKSQRLKKLTEDLVEASKASSGNLKLNIEKLEVNELIKQVSAEFADKFKARNLEEVITFAKKSIYIEADNRYMYRVLENMYSNVSKYAMENTRVYTDIIEHGNNVIIQIKNISKEKLNITSDELMQRFVRGDTSRNTEGSGLGLSIAKSLTELQKGQFHIYLDGDLFKITIGFKKML